MPQVVTEILDRPTWRTRPHAPDSAGAKGAGNPSEGSESTVRETKLEADADAVDTVTKGGGKIPVSDPVAEMLQEPTESAGRVEGDLSREVVEGDGCDGVCGNAEGMLGGASCLGDGAGDSNILRLVPGSVLHLRDGGYAPGEEECGRDEEL